jgi:subtilisin family serine protease
MAKIIRTKYSFKKNTKISNPIPGGYVNVHKFYQHIKNTKLYPVTVAILDFEVDFNHYLLKNDKAERTYLILQNGQWEKIIHPSRKITDHHGTNCAGIIAGNWYRFKDGKYFGGLFPDCSLLSVKIDDVTANDVANVINYIAGKNPEGKLLAKVINISYSLETNSAITDSINFAISKGCIICCATGLDGGLSKPQIRFPASLPDVIRSGLLNESKDIPSNAFDNSITTYARGKSVWTLSNNAQFSNPEGSSFSNAFVSGVAALMASIYPNITHQQVKAILSVKNTKERKYSYNALNTYQAVWAAKSLS